MAGKIRELVRSIQTQRLSKDVERQVSAAGDGERTSISVAIPKNWAGFETQRATKEALARLDYAPFNYQHHGRSISMDVGPAPEVHLQKRETFLQKKQAEIDELVQKALAGQTTGLSFHNDAAYTLATSGELENLARERFAAAGLNVNVRSGGIDSPDLYLLADKFTIELKPNKD